jgi:hypothetical protein
MRARSRAGCRRRGTLVERHRHVGAEQLLDLHGLRRAEPDLAAVEVRPERDAVVVDLPPLRQGQDLIAARVGQHGACPCSEAVQAAERGDPLGARAQHQVVGVAEDHARAARGDLRATAP